MKHFYKLMKFFSIQVFFKNLVLEDFIHEIFELKKVFICDFIKIFKLNISQKNKFFSKHEIVRNMFQGSILTDIQNLDTLLTLF